MAQHNLSTKGTDYSRLPPPDETKARYVVFDTVGHYALGPEVSYEAAGAPACDQECGESQQSDREAVGGRLGAV